MKEDFLQSKEWLDFQRKTGKEVFDISQNNFIARIIKIPLPWLGHYFYLPRGPFFNKENKEIRENFLKKIYALAQEEKVDWIRIEPSNKKDLILMQENSQYFFQKAPLNIQPSQTLEINIEQSPENILANMKAKTRYNIRLAQRKNLVIEKISKLETEKEQKLFNQFWKLIQKTSQRQKIKPHPYRYYRLMLESLPFDQKSLYLVKKGKNIIAGALIVFYQKKAIYLHGAFDDQYRSLMAPFLLHWKIIQEAQKKGCQWYDWGGVKVKKDQGKLKAEKGNWEGITRFKLGFSRNPRIINYPGTYDIVLNKTLYNFYKVLSKIKRNLV